MLTSIDDNNKEVDNRYLDITKLKLDKFYEGKLAFLDSYKSDVTVTHKGYYIVRFRDCNSNIITGMFFDEGNFVNNGLKISDLKRKPVSISFQTSEYKGSLSITLREIMPLPLDVEFDYSSFIGRVSNAKEIIDTSNIFITKTTGNNNLKLNPDMIHENIEGVDSGLCGGFTTIVNLCTQGLLVCNTLQNLDRAELMTSYCHILNAYFKYLRLLSTDDIYTKHDKIELVYKTVENLEDKHVVTDALLSLMGMCECDSLYGNIIVSKIREAEEMIRLTTQYSLMTELSTKRVGDKLLRKY